MQCELCKKEITGETVIVPEIRTPVLDEEPNISAALSLDNLYSRRFMHRWCFDYYSNRTYQNWLQVNKHNPFFVKNDSLFPEHFMYNHQKCKFCDNKTDKFSVWETNGRSHISALTNIQWEDTVHFTNKLYLPLCNRHFAENYNNFSKETFMDAYHYYGEEIVDFDKIKPVADTEDWANNNLAASQSEQSSEECK